MILIGAVKTFDKIQYPFMIKTLQKVVIDGIYLNTIKAICDKPTENITLNGEKLKAFALRSGKRHRCLLSPQLLNTLLEVLATEIREEKRDKSYPNWKRRSKTSTVCRWHNIHKNTKDDIRKLLEFINTFVWEFISEFKVAEYKTNTQKPLALLYTTN